MSRRLEAERTQSREHQQPPDAGALFVGVHLGQLQAEALGEVLVAEVVEAGALPGRVADGIDREVGRLRLPVVDGHPLDVVEDGGGQVVDFYDVAHRTPLQLAR